MDAERVNESPEPKLIELAERSFKTVMDVDVHLDNKASRILSAMAFLTAAAAAIFAKAYSPGLSAGELQQTLTQALSSHVSQAELPTVVSSVVESLQKPHITILGLDWALFAFSGYMLFVLLGAVLYLAALGPALNLPPWFRGGSSSGESGESGKSSESDKIKSLLFFELIADLERDAWYEHWTKKRPAELQNQMADNFVYESQLIAQKAKAKFTWMSWGSAFFKAAILFLMPLIGSLSSSESRIGWSVTLLGIAILLGGLAFETWRRPPQKIRFWTVLWGTLAILDLVVLILILVGVF